MCKFKIGDDVTIINETNKHPVGTVGKIINVIYSPGFSPDTVYTVKSGDTIYEYFSNDLELVRPNTTIKKKLILLLGKSGSGKDYLSKGVCNLSTEFTHFYPEFKLLKKDTTRPMRENETYGDPYNFISESQFKDKKMIGEYLSISTYKTEEGEWLYGLNMPCDDINVAVGDILLFGNIYNKITLGQVDFKLYPILIKTNDKDRLINSVNRTPNKLFRVCKRFVDDEKEYSDQNILYNWVIDHPNLRILENKFDSFSDVEKLYYMIRDIIDEDDKISKDKK